MGTVAGNTGSDIVDYMIPLTDETLLMTYYNPYQTSRFENGRLQVLGDFWNVAYNDSSMFYVSGEVDPAAQGETFYVTDDDDFDNDDSPNNGDYGDSVSELNALDKVLNTGAYAANVFAPAYITLINDGGGTIGNNNTTAFHLNANEGNLDDIYAAKYDSWPDGADNFWVAYIVMGYQPLEGVDNDPVAETDEELGITKGFADDDIGAGCLDVPEGGKYSFVWQETARDYFVEQSASNDNLTGAHELGHQLGLDERTGNYLMSESVFGYATLHPNEIHILRCRTKAPGRS